MSRIGKLPIPLNPKVKVSVEEAVVTVQGPKGSLAHKMPRGIDAAVEGERIVVRRADDSKTQRALHGLARSLLANAVHGVTEGFSKQLEIHGVGYRGQVKGKTVTFTLGYTHPVEFSVPDDLEVKVEGNKVTVSGADRQKVGQMAADIRALRPPDVYKLKGVRYTGEHLRKKAGKSGVK
jgi:large subunit ribosomal protein L6